MKKTLICLFVLVALSMGYTQDKAALNGAKRGTGTAASAATITVDNPYASVTATFEEKFNGSPSTVSVVISGCMRGSTCDVLETYVIATNANRSPTIAKPYDYFTIVPTFTGGTAPTATVNWTLK